MAETVRKNLGMVTAYAYAVSKGYTGTEEEFAELMASYADVAQDAEASAQAAAQSATTAEQKATQAAGSATNAAVSATSASESAQAAAGSSNSASLYAQNASASATNAAGSASSASTYAGNASASAQDAEGSANAAQESATQAAESATTATAKAGEAATSATTAVEAAQRAEDAAATLVIDDTLTHAGQAADAKKTGDEIGDLKENLSDVDSAIGEIDTYVGFNPATHKIIDPSGTQITVTYSEISFHAESGEIVVANVQGSAFANNPTIYLYGVVNGATTSLGSFKANQDKSVTLGANYDGFAIYATNLVSGKTIDFAIRKGNVFGLNKRITDLEDINPVSQNGVNQVKTVNFTDVATNVISDIGNKTLTGSGKYVNETIYTIEKTFIEGETYYLTAHNVVGATAVNSMVAVLYHGNTEIRRTNGNATAPTKMELSAEDVTAGANKIEFILYPAMGTVLPTGSAVFYDVKISMNGTPYYTAIGNLKDAVFGGNNFNLPNYWFANDYLKEKTQRINELASSGDDAFFFITDVHWSLNSKYSPDLINYISRQCNIHRLFDGGDISQGTLDSMKMPVDAYRSSYDGKIYRVAGNHDWFSPATAKSIYYGLNETENNDQIGDVYNLYWYTDNMQAKIRYVVLNAFRYENSACIYGFDSTQVSWFTNSALNVPDGYDVIVFAHYFREATGYNGYTDIESAIASFNADTSRHGKVLCIFQGHTHYDSLWETSSGVPVITTTCDKWDFSNENGYEAMASERSFGNKSEQAFDVVIVNRTVQKIYCVRIGYPAQNNVEKKIGDTGFTFVGTLEERDISYS